MITMTVDNRGYDRFMDLVSLNPFPMLVCLDSNGTASFTMDEKHYKKAAELWHIVQREMWD